MVNGIIVKDGPTITLHTVVVPLTNSIWTASGRGKYYSDAIWTCPSGQKIVGIYISNWESLTANINIQPYIKNNITLKLISNTNTEFISTSSVTFQVATVNENAVITA